MTHSSKRCQPKAAYDNVEKSNPLPTQFTLQLYCGGEQTGSRNGHHEAPPPDRSSTIGQSDPVSSKRPADILNSPRFSDFYFCTKRADVEIGIKSCRRVVIVRLLSSRSLVSCWCSLVSHGHTVYELLTIFAIVKLTLICFGRSGKAWQTGNDVYC